MGKSTVITSGKGGVRLLKRLLGRLEKQNTLQGLHSPAQKIARDYISQKKKWHPEEYRFEYLGMNDKDGYYSLYVVHRDDERLTLPMAGKSVELHINLDKKRVIRELHEQ